MSDPVLIAIITTVPTTIAALAAWWAKGAKTQASGANRATNNIDPDDPDQRTLRERVAGLEDDFGEFRTSYGHDQSRISDQHLGIQHELGRLAGVIEATQQRNHP